MITFLAPSLKSLLFVTSAVVLLLAANQATAADQKHPDRPRKIFAHYMGCYPLGNRSLSVEYMRKGQGQLLPDGDSYLSRIGGRWRDFPLTPENYKPTLEEAMDVEIRRAMRMGLDGFAVDVLAGQADAIASIDAMFKVAEEKDYPFEITFCLDNPEMNLKAIAHLMEKHGKSPKLARRDGKPLLLGYRSHRIGERLRPDIQGKAWLKPESVEAYNKALEELEAIAGEPIYAQFCLNGALAGQSDMDTVSETNNEEFWKGYLTAMGRKFGGVNGFFWGGPTYDLAAKVARGMGMDWGDPVWVQYQNLYWNTFRVKDGTDLLRERWERAIANDSTLIQIATWNDYTEATNVAPGQQTGYAINDLMGLMIKRWKTGQWPTFEKDRIYFFYPPYPGGSPVFPFHDFSPDLTNSLEVVTYLKGPGTVSMPGRNETWEAPAGLFVKKLPATAGPVVAELKRKDQPVLTLSAKEPISALPFRGQHSLTAFSTEDERYWKEDFPTNSESMMAYYGDLDGDGLPNWFEMFYFGKLGDFATATGADPEAKVPGSKMTVREAYLQQVDPRGLPQTATVKWDLLSNPMRDTGISTNPEAASPTGSSWRYVGSTKEGEWHLLSNASISPPRDVMHVTYSRSSRNSFAPPAEPAPVGQVSYQWIKPSKEGEEWARLVRLSPTGVEAVAIEWPSPAKGNYKMNVSVQRDARSSGAAKHELHLVDSKGASLWKATLDPQTPQATTEIALPLPAGDTVRLEARALTPSAQGSLEVTQFLVEKQN